MHLPNFKKPIDQQLVDKLISYFQSVCKKGHKIMVSVDESINSQVAAMLIGKASKEDAIAMIVDLGSSQINSLSNFCQKLGLKTFILDRQAAYKAEVDAFGKNHHFKRFIAYHLLIQADLMRAKVLDYLDKSDRLLGVRPEGFYGHFMPFYSLYKSELYELASLLHIPVTRDETYEKVDPILYLLTEKQLTPEEIAEQHNIDIHWLRSLRLHINKQLFQTITSQFII